MTTVLNPFEPSVYKGASSEQAESAISPERADSAVRLADPAKPGGASDYSDPNPVEPEHILNLMRSNFPEPAIDWVKRTSWVGPIDIPWDRINDANIDSWAASHQPGKVNDFVRDLKENPDSVKPSICIQGHNGNKVDIIDGHHRAIAHKKMGTGVRAYLGTVQGGAKDLKAALETHAMQFHAGTDPRNKAYADARRYLVIEDLLTKLDGFWFSRETGRPAQRREVFKALAGLRDAGYDERLLALQAKGFGWSVEQLDNEFLRAWLCGT